MKTTARTTGSRTPLPPPRCGRCEFTSLGYDRRKAAELLLEYAGHWQRVLAGPDVGRRYSCAAAWSPLEHGCHVRDMCLLFHRRIDTTLGTAPSGAPAADGPEPPPGRDEDAGRASEELGLAAEALAGRFATLTADDWEHEDPRLPELRLTVDFLTRHFLHDIVHDLSEVLRRPQGIPSGGTPRIRTESSGQPWLS
ncbi:hypothetical protein [Streptomyces sp. SP18CS02]|uniref:hypothetical protein n=1 Tax=Streptomyces sp. SP18CS02 TaxID=3002531 RepID=UPI002E7A2929|nr:hypothetical protein [Streptomyces sp. SP18CS02]MEE1755221.1 hypothetical protein [Streptomyces sp. SP18CS02]